ncbi:hypothetical protein HEP81_01561 [Streptomyces griseofuscus]|uniref:Uncharacterized protein n=1 Tax=Streptomyces griseofuscus TaxID=146922 RepID=A0A7H1PV10_9ACTN|nr:hypothetical protein HEP81_01561 [Streptomyces griseofuscus]
MCCGNYSAVEPGIDRRRSHFQHRRTALHIRNEGFDVAVVVRKARR